MFEKDYPKVVFDKEYHHDEGHDFHRAARLLDTFSKHDHTMFVEFVRYADIVIETCKKKNYSSGSVYDNYLSAFVKFTALLHRFASGELVWYPASKEKKAEKNKKKKEKCRARSKVAKEHALTDFVLQLAIAGEKKQQQQK